MLKKAYNAGIAWDYAGRNVRASKPQTRGSWGRGGGGHFFSDFSCTHEPMCIFRCEK